MGEVAFPVDILVNFFRSSRQWRDPSDSLDGTRSVNVRHGEWVLQRVISVSSKQGSCDWALRLSTPVPTRARGSGLGHDHVHGWVQAKPGAEGMHARVASRTVDLPFLPVHGSEHLPVAWGVGNGVPVFPGDRIEQVGLPDLVCLAAELATVAALCALSTPLVRRLTTSGLLVLGLAMVAMRVVGVLG